MARLTATRPASPEAGSSRAPRIATGAWVSLAASFVMAVLLFVADAASRWEFVSKVSATSFSEIPPHAAAVPPGSREEWLVIPYYAMDARWWVLHTEKMLREGTWRVRNTQLDNAPHGREVHWSSLLMWVLAGTAHFQAWLSGIPASSHIAEATLGAGPILLCGFLVGTGFLVWRRFGAFNALFFGTVFLTTFPIVRAFVLSEADHHGIVLGFALAAVFCIVAGGGGFVRTRPKDSNILLDQAVARRWFFAGGILGAAALWVSAATAIPILFGTALGGLLVALVLNRRPSSATFDPTLWTRWGWGGFLGSIFFYLLEYFPDHLGWRLEVNHPIWGLAWLAGSFVLSKVLGRMVLGRALWQSPTEALLLATAVVAAVAPLAVVALAPDRTFWVADRFLLAIHKQFIHEFQSLPTLVAMTEGNLAWLSYYPWAAVTLVGAIGLAIKKQLGPIGRIGLLLLAPPTLIMQALAIHQVRWSSALFALWTLCAVVLMIDISRHSAGARGPRWVFRSLLACAWLALLVTILPQVAARTEEERLCLEPPIPKEIAGNLLLRDVAHRLIQSSPQQVPVVLTGPNASTEMTYHSGVRTLGTLYWENMPGLKRAAEIFSAKDAAEALRLLTAAGVTHIVIPSWDNFATPYANTYAESLGQPTEGAPFFEAISKGNDFPQWLRPFAYPIPTDSGLDTNSVKIFAVLPQQSLFEAYLFRGIYHYETNESSLAREMLEKAQAVRPGDPRPANYLKAIDAAQKP
ncbi:MAG: hypothetical protein SFU53_00230 [Terrimicrobiaceae bacterium]|nr:hypothetical protein [Terrimicrobiaceae bacterium]